MFPCDATYGNVATETHTHHVTQKWVKQGTVLLNLTGTPEASKYIKASTNMYVRQRKYDM